MVGITAGLLCGTAQAQQEVTSDEWQFLVTPYAWLPTIKGDLNYGLGNLKIDPDDILSGLNMALLVSGEARKGKWSVLGDVVYLNMSDKAHNAASIPLDGGAEADVDVTIKLKNWTVNGTGGYSVYADENVNLDVIGGARYVYMESELVAQAPDLGVTRNDTIDATVWNAIIGVRGNYNFYPSWYIPYYLDIGTGGSNFTWQAMAGVGYQFNWGDILLAYRYLSFDQDNGDAMEELSIDGAALGVRFSF